MYKLSIEITKHIEREASFVLKFTKGKTYDEFCNDETLTRAVVRSLEIIGEASKKIDVEFKAKYPQIEWKQMARLRDKLIHDYEGVDYIVVWEIVQNDIPELYFQITEILKNNTEEIL